MGLLPSSAPSFSTKTESLSNPNVFRNPGSLLSSSSSKSSLEVETPDAEVLTDPAPSPLLNPRMTSVHGEKSAEITSPFSFTFVSTWAVPDAVRLTSDSGIGIS